MTQCKSNNLFYSGVKWVRGKKVPGKMAPWKNVLKKLFVVKRILGNLNDFFLFLSIDSSTHSKRCLTFTSRSYIQAANCKTLKSPGRFVVRFWVFIDWSHPNILPTHTTPLDAHPTIFSGTIFPGIISPGTNIPATIFPRTFFPGDHFSEDSFSKGPFFQGIMFQGIFFRHS